MAALQMTKHMSDEFGVSSEGLNFGTSGIMSTCDSNTALKISRKFNLEQFVGEHTMDANIHVGHRRRERVNGGDRVDIINILLTPRKPSRDLGWYLHARGRRRQL